MVAALAVAPACTGDDAPDASAASSTPTTARTTSSAAPGCDRPAELADGRHTIISSNEPRDYLLSLPATWDGETPLPLILNFHGSGSDMDQQTAYSDLPARGTARGFAVLTPQGTGSPRGWQLGGGKDDVLIHDLLAAFGACVDEDRVSAIGISNGSAFAALTACRLPHRIAAVGMVAATLGSTCQGDHRVPAIAFHGTEDRTVPYGGGAVNSRGANGLSAPGAEGAIAAWASANDVFLDFVDEIGGA